MKKSQKFLSKFNERVDRENTNIHPINILKYPKIH